MKRKLSDTISSDSEYDSLNEDETSDIGNAIALNSDLSSSDSDSNDEEDNLIEDIIDYSDNEDTTTPSKTTTSTEFPSLYEQNKSDNDDGEDDLNDYFSTNINSKNKFKKGSFASFGLSRLILKNITNKGFRQPTPIQRKTLPLILQNRDIVGMARTGSGKTAAFVLPMIEKLKTHSSKIGARGLILSPSRELAMQTFKVFKEFSKGTHLRSVLLTGGDSLEDQFDMIMGNPDVIVATPGRFLHLKVEMNLDLKTMEYVVFDEADRLFEMGFEEQLNELLVALPTNRQTLLFSATLPNSLVDFAKAGLTNPVLVRLDAESRISENLEMLYLSCKNGERESNLLYLLQDVIKIPIASDDEIKALKKFNNFHDEDSSDDDNDKDSKDKSKKKNKKFNKKLFSTNEISSDNATIIFVPTRHHVEYISQLLQDAGYLVSHIYGTLDQHARKSQLHQFRSGLTRILVVTDVAARGVDIPLLPYVINYTMPSSSKIFVHRVGRTARAGNKGWAYSLIGESELPYLLDLEVFLGKKLLLTPAYEKLCELKNDKNLKINYSNRMVLGSAPRFDIENLDELYKNLFANNFDLQLMKKTSMKAEKLYLRTRGGASAESVKRSKEVKSNGWDEQNIKFGKDAEKEKNALLASFLNRRKKDETVFEFGKNGEDELAILMNRRRRQVAPVQRKARERRDILEKERAAGLSHRLEDEYELTENQDDNEKIVDEDKIAEVFEDGNSLLNDKKSKKFRDENFFMSHYAPIQSVQDKQLNLNTGFVNEASNAAYDLNDDDKVQTHKQSSAVVQWDRKRKKYVNTRGLDNKKYIIGESGRKIPASFRSGKFDEWAKARRIDPRVKVGAREAEGTGNKYQKDQKFKHNKDKAPKLPDKFRDDYKRQKEKIKKAGERGIQVRGQKVIRSEFNSVEQIRKNRMEKDKRRAKNGRHQKKRKF